MEENEIICHTNSFKYFKAHAKQFVCRINLKELSMFTFTTSYEISPYLVTIMIIIIYFYLVFIKIINF